MIDIAEYPYNALAVCLALLAIDIVLFRLAVRRNRRLAREHRLRCNLADYRWRINHED